MVRACFYLDVRGVMANRGIARASVYTSR